MFRGLYKLLITPRMYQVNLFGYLDVAEKYGKIHTDPMDAFDRNGRLNLTEEERKEPVFIAVKDESDAYAVFYENLFILFSINDELGDKIVQIYIKRPEDEWTVPVNEDGTLDLLNPSNIKVEVYVNYDVSVLKLNRRLSRCSGEDYKSGVWNKMFYRSFNAFLRKIENYTDINQIKLAYER